MTCRSGKGGKLAVAKLILILGFVTAFGAGLVVGVNLHGREASAAPATQPSGRGGFLESELKLTPEQREQMKNIWSDTARRGGRDHEDRRRQYRKERDDAIATLIKPEEKERFEQVQKVYADRNAALEKEFAQRIESSVEKTKQILTPEQRVKYEEILKKQAADRAARDREQGRRVEDRATTRPSPDK
jgi:Spy/CpxP family protein refolding chaperone